MATEYVPGTCNIGRGEIRQRQFVAAIGFLLFIAASITIFTTDAPQVARLALFFPLVMTSIGWVQSRKRFCLAYGLMGTFNFGKLGQLSRVHDQSSLRADRRTALKILGQGLLYAVVATGGIFLLPI